MTLLGPLLLVAAMIVLPCALAICCAPVGLHRRSPRQPGPRTQGGTLLGMTALLFGLLRA